MKLILPKTHAAADAALQSLPLFFLAGPILGGGDWRGPMSDLVARRAGDCLIVNPSRYDERHPSFGVRIAGDEGAFPRQTAWERHYLEAAGKSWPRGGIIFWLAAESADRPRTDGQPYAMDTRGEIGEWRGRLMSDPALRVVIGADPDFPGLRSIRRNMALALGAEAVVLESMEAVAERAVSLAMARA